MSEKHVDQIADKRDAILETALKLFVERGFYGTPTSLISKEAGVATGTLFFYFPTKEDLIDALYRQIKSEAGAALKDGVDGNLNTKEKLFRVWENAIGWAMKYPLKYRFMEQFAHSPFISKMAQEEGMSHFLFLRDILKEGLQSGLINNFEPKLLCSILTVSLSGVVSRVMATPDPDEKERIKQQGLVFLWNGLAIKPQSTIPEISDVTIPKTKKRRVP